jgi:hypothetical protein
VSKQPFFFLLSELFQEFHGSNTKLTTSADFTACAFGCGGV